MKWNQTPSPPYSLPTHHCVRCLSSNFDETILNPGGRALSLESSCFCFTVDRTFVFFCGFFFLISSVWSFLHRPLPGAFCTTWLLGANHNAEGLLQRFSKTQRQIPFFTTASTAGPKDDGQKISQTQNSWRTRAPWSSISHVLQLSLQAPSQCPFLPPSILCLFT